MSLLAAAERLLALTGDAVALCPNHGIGTLPTSAAMSTPHGTPTPGRCS